MNEQTEKVIPDYVKFLPFDLNEYPVCPKCQVIMKDVPDECPGCGIKFEKEC